MENEKAEKTYDDNIAKGNVAALLKKSKDSDELLEIDIGNILPGKSAIVEIIILQTLEVQNGAYDFVFPMTYCPNYGNSYKQIEAYQLESGKQSLKFNFRADIKSKQHLYEVSHPKDCEILEQSFENITITNANQDFRNLDKDIHIFYRTINMDTPKFVYQKSEDFPGYIALMA